ncbi:MAG: UDP-N-acetylglucosamine--N-acetylmuramyl-(pentapeptide) pyrophosphoryl-undecaprenol N-acetylglucosamine transferase [Phycisphaerae bacterium]|nr:UDP-N-acetylglucosamine--N-acetylmuramyl-(pentapeptide) pyrophosphoryl-undecaprenol N-acetylglucosamine transferase [Phycisphaerae bacterium]
MGRPIYIFAGGGTGGHLYPGLAVAEELNRLRPDARIVFACSHRPIDRHILDPLAYAVVPQPARPMPRGVLGWGRFAMGLAIADARARQMVRDLKPAAVLGLGSYAAVPVVRAAAKVGVPTAMLNPDAVPGKANRYLARFADVIFTQFVMTAESFPVSVRKGIRRVGCPLRSGLAGANRDEAVEYFSLRDDRKTLLVFGASQGASSINNAVTALAGELDELADTWQMLHFTGAGKVGQSAGPTRMHTVAREYCDRMDLAYAAADCALCRAGASTVAELAVTATPAILMPYPHHADKQQWLNAAGLVEAGGAMICEDTADAEANVENLRHSLIPLLGDLASVENMSRAAKVMARPEATREVTGWLAGAVR